jgi:asparagine synthetase B (glutamine-hydrolysing)
MEIEKEKIRKLLENEVEKCINNGCEGILLSGGLDTSILRFIKKFLGVFQRQKRMK